MKRRRGRAVLSCHSADGRGTAASSVLAAPVQASRATHRTMLCPSVPHACVPSQRARSTFTNLPQDAFAGIMQQHKTPSCTCQCVVCAQSCRTSDKRAVIDTNNGRDSATQL